MTNDDWFRNTKWNDKIETAFFSKLNRARDKSQYLRIQASYLTERYPQIALRLIDKYLQLGEHFDLAQAHVDRADAYLTLGDVSQALKCFEAALDREEQYPKVLTQAYLDFPLLVAMHKIKEHYVKAQHTLDKHVSRLMFPVDHFLWHAGKAFILENIGEVFRACTHAKSALEAASKDHSGFPRHPNVGLVGKKYENIYKRLVNLASA